MVKPTPDQQTAIDAAVRQAQSIFPPIGKTVITITASGAATFAVDKPGDFEIEVIEQKAAAIVRTEKARAETARQDHQKKVSAAEALAAAKEAGQGNGQAPKGPK